MIRYAIYGKDATLTSIPTVRSICGGDPKLKVALPPVALPAQPAEVRREKAIAAVNSVTERDSVTSKRDKRDMARDRQRRRRAKLEA